MFSSSSVVQQSDPITHISLCCAVGSHCPSYILLSSSLPELECELQQKEHIEQYWAERLPIFVNKKALTSWYRSWWFVWVLFPGYHLCSPSPTPTPLLGKWTVTHIQGEDTLGEAWREFKGGYIFTVLMLWFSFLGWISSHLDSYSPGLWSSAKGMGLPHTGNIWFWGSQAGTGQGTGPDDLEQLLSASGKRALAPPVSWVHPSFLFQVVKTLPPAPRWECGSYRRGQIGSSIALGRLFKSSGQQKFIWLAHISRPRAQTQGPGGNKEFTSLGASCFLNSLLNLWKQWMAWKNGDWEFSLDCLALYILKMQPKSL